MAGPHRESDGEGAGAGVTPKTKQLLNQRVIDSIRERGMDCRDVMRDEPRESKSQMTPEEQDKLEKKRQKNRVHAKQSRQRRNSRYAKIERENKILNTYVRVLRALVDRCHRQYTGLPETWTEVGVEYPMSACSSSTNTLLDIDEDLKPYPMLLPTDVTDALKIHLAPPYKSEEVLRFMDILASCDMAELTSGAVCDLAPHGAALTRQTDTDLFPMQQNLAEYQVQSMVTMMDGPSQGPGNVTGPETLVPASDCDSNANSFDCLSPDTTEESQSDYETIQAHMVCQGILKNLRWNTELPKHSSEPGYSNEEEPISKVCKENYGGDSVSDMEIGCNNELFQKNQAIKLPDQSPWMVNSQLDGTLSESDEDFMLMGKKPPKGTFLGRSLKKWTKKGEAGEQLKSKAHGRLPSSSEMINLKPQLLNKPSTLSFGKSTHRHIETEMQVPSQEDKLLSSAISLATHERPNGFKQRKAFSIGDIDDGCKPEMKMTELLTEKMKAEEPSVLPDALSVLHESSNRYGVGEQNDLDDLLLTMNEENVFFSSDNIRNVPKEDKSTNDTNVELYDANSWLPCDGGGQINTLRAKQGDEEQQLDFITISRTFSTRSIEEMDFQTAEYLEPSLTERILTPLQYQ